MRERIEKMKAFTRWLTNVEIQLRQKDGVDALQFPVSSEEPVDRWFGTEILSHENGAVRLKRAKKGAVPLLFNHNTDDPVGVIDDAWLEKNRLWVETHFFDTSRAREVATMVSGGLHNVSIAYRMHTIEEDKDQEVFTATDWEPLEVSIVSVPADASVGVGRNSPQYEVRMISADSSARGEKMKTKEQLEAEADAQKDSLKREEPGGANRDPKPAETEPAKRKNGGAASVAVEEERGHDLRDPVEMEKERKRAISNLCKMNNLDDKYRDMWIGKGLSVEQVTDELLRILEERGRTNPQPRSKIGMTPSEAQTFSMTRAILACKDQDWKRAGFELECSRTVEQALKVQPDPNKFYVPFEVLERPVDHEAARELRRRLGLRQLTVADSESDAGFLVDTRNVGFIELLRNRAVVFRMGAQRLTGLQGNVTIPRQSAAATAFWLETETSEVDDTKQVIEQVLLSPKNVSAYTEIGRQLLLQSSPGAEGIVSDDLAIVVALAVDFAAVAGTGIAGQPKGILATDGVGVGAGTLDYDGSLALQEALAEANVMPLRGGYVTTPHIARVLMGVPRFEGGETPVWAGNIWDGVDSGFPAMSSNQVPAATRIFGDWNELVIGEWGVLEVEVNPFANFKAGIIGVRAMYSVDVALRRPFAFAADEEIPSGS